MPKGGIEARANTVGTIGSLAHETFASSELGELLSHLEEDAKDEPYDSDRASLLRRAPPIRPGRQSAFRGRCGDRQGNGTGPSLLGRSPSATRFYAVQTPPRAHRPTPTGKADALGYKHEAYNALLDLYEPEMTADQVSALFDQLKAELVPLAHAIADRTDTVSDAVFMQEYPEDPQWAFTLEVIERLGF